MNGDEGRISEIVQDAIEAVPEVVRNKVLREGVSILEISRAIAPYRHDHERRILLNMSVQFSKSFLDEAWEALVTEDRAAIATSMAKKLAKDLAGNGLDSRVREHLFQLVSTLAEKELEARTSQIAERVAQEVNARWESAIETVVKAQVDKALAKVRAELVRA